MRNTVSTRNDITRAMVNQQLQAMKTGQQFRSMDLATTLSQKRRDVSARTVGKLLQERKDVVLVDRCMSKWEKRNAA